MIQVYSPNNTNYDNNGDIALFPSSAPIHVILNGAWTAELYHPIDKEGRWKYIVESAVVKMPSFNGDQLFRVKKVTKQDSGVYASMEPIFYDSMNDCFLDDVRPTGKNGQEALDILLAENSKYTGQSNITRVETAYYQYVNFMEALNGDLDQSFLNRWGGEILFDNYTVVVNDRVGGDYGAEIRYGKNIPKDGMAYDVDITNVVTRIYPKAFNGRTMSGTPYIDSPLIEKYPLIMATTITFEKIKLVEDIDGDPQEGDIVCQNQSDLNEALRQACEDQFLAGIDKPTVSISCSMVLLQNTEQYKDVKELEEVSLGDTVHCHNNHLGITTDTRVIELEYDAIRKKVSSVVLGNFQYNYFNNVTSSVNRVEQAIRPDGSVMAERVQGILNGIYTQLRLQSTAAQPVDGIAFRVEVLDPESPLYGCMIWGTQGIQISRTRTADEKDWDWTTAMTATGIVADSIVTGLLTDKTGRNYWDLDTGEFQLSSTATVGGDKIATVNETIKSVDVEYSSGDSSTVPPTSGWNTGSPEWEAGKYIWQRTVTTMADGSKNISDPTCIQGAAGENGESTTITTNIIDYAVSNSGTTPPQNWTQNIPSVTPGQFLWTRNTVKYSDGTSSISYGVSYQGEKGENGDNGVGISSSSVMYQASDSGTAVPTGNWQQQVPEMTPGSFLWTRTQFSYTDGSTTTLYSVSYQGENGSQGIPGPAGEDGRTLYTWIKYADTPTSGMSDNPDGKKYLGISYNNESAIESTNYSDYQWSEIQGKDGIPGPAGEDGRTLYTWIKYATSASGANMSDSPDGRDYIGIAYNKTTPTESNSPSDYAWSLIQGEAGIGVDDIEEQYYLSTSSTSQSGGSWSTSQPTWQKNRYIWTRSKITWSDNSITYTTPVLAKAINGANQAASDLDEELDQQGVFNRLTNNGASQGIILRNGQLYINASYIASGQLRVGGLNNQDGEILVYNSSGSLIGSWNSSGLMSKGNYFTVNDDGKTYASVFHCTRLCLAPTPTNDILNVSTVKSNYSTAVSMGTYASGTGVSGNALRMGSARSGDPKEIYSITIGKNNVTNSVRIYGSTTINDDLRVTGEKNRLVKTEGYGERLMYSYEMSSPMFGDVGTAVTDENGECIIPINNLFFEMVSPQVEYQVFLQKEGPGEIWVNEKKPTYFVVKGSPNLKFSWEIKVKQKGYEYNRMEPGLEKEPVTGVEKLLPLSYAQTLEEVLLS